MTFRIIMTCIYAFGISSTLSDIDRPRKPMTAGTALAAAVLNCVFIYGLWNWL